MFMGRDFGTERDYGDEVAAIIDQEVKYLVDSQYDYVRTLIRDNRDIMDAIVKVLLEKETLDNEQFVAIMEDVRAIRAEAASRNGVVMASPHVAEES
jgi:cell division protease FtsH